MHVQEQARSIQVSPFQFCFFVMRPPETKQLTNISCYSAMLLMKNFQTAQPNLNVQRLAPSLPFLVIVWYWCILSPWPNRSLYVQVNRLQVFESSFQSGWKDNYLIIAAPQNALIPYNPLQTQGHLMQKICSNISCYHVYRLASRNEENISINV